MIFINLTECACFHCLSRKAQHFAVLWQITVRTDGPTNPSNIALRKELVLRFYPHHYLEIGAQYTSFKNMALAIT